MSFDDFNRMLQPLAVKYDLWSCHQADVAFMEGAVIALCSMYLGPRTRDGLHKYGVITASLSPSFRPLNMTTGVEKGKDLSPEAQSRRGKIGGKLGGKLVKAAYARRLGMDEGEEISLSEYQAALDPEGAHAARIKVSSPQQSVSPIAIRTDREGCRRPNRSGKVSNLRNPVGRHQARKYCS